MDKLPELILASKSKARQEMLKNAGLAFRIHPAELDEERILDQCREQTLTAEQSAEVLAKEKAKAVSELYPEALVIGADQILALDNEILMKAEGEEQAYEKLLKLNGRTHSLFSAASIAYNGMTRWSHTDYTDMTMHDLPDDVLKTYVRKAGPALTRAVGAYEIEGLGSWLFKAVQGDYFTVLGLPLLPLLTYLREQENVSL